MQNRRATVFALFLPFLLAGCGAVPKTDAPCSQGFRNGTQGVLSDADLQTAWSHAQQTIAQGNWVINALTCSEGAVPPPCQLHPPDARALSEQPDCLSVKGTNGQPEAGIDGEQQGNAIAIRIDKGHDRAWALASWEMENVIGERLGFPMGDR